MASNIFAKKSTLDVGLDYEYISGLQLSYFTKNDSPLEFHFFFLHEKIWIPLIFSFHIKNEYEKLGILIKLTLSAQTSKNGQTHSNILSETADKLFECD